MKYYLSGPMTGYPDFNHPTFDKVALMMRSEGLQVRNPAEVLMPSNKTEFAYGDYIRADLALLLECEGIVMLPGWTRSTGAKLELDVALTMGCEAYTLDHKEYENGRIVLNPM